MRLDQYEKIYITHATYFILISSEKNDTFLLKRTLVGSKNRENNNSINRYFLLACNL